MFKRRDIKEPDPRQILKTWTYPNLFTSENTQVNECMKGHLFQNVDVYENKEFYEEYDDLTKLVIKECLRCGFVTADFHIFLLKNNDNKKPKYRRFIPLGIVNNKFITRAFEDLRLFYENDFNKECKTEFKQRKYFTIYDNDSYFYPSNYRISLTIDKCNDCDFIEISLVEENKARYSSQLT